MKISNVVLVVACSVLLKTECEATLCDEDYHVVSNVCQACPSGESNLAGDDASGQDTSCDTCRITTNQELRDHVDSWIANPLSHPCGKVIGDWEVGRVTDMSYVFCASTWYSQCNTNRSDFNADISKWNTASVTDLRSTFEDATSFTGDGVSNWDTSSVTDLSFTFYGATSFTGNGLFNWDTSSVYFMEYTFTGATSFTGYGLIKWTPGDTYGIGWGFDDTHTTKKER